MHIIQALPIRRTGESVSIYRSRQCARCHWPATSGRPRSPRRRVSVRYRRSPAGCYKRAARTWRKGRRKGLKIPWEQSRVGSIPTVRTTAARGVPDCCGAASSLILTTKKQAGSCCSAQFALRGDGKTPLLDQASEKPSPSCDRIAAHLSSVNLPSKPICGVASRANMRGPAHAIRGRSANPATAPAH